MWKYEKSKLLKSLHKFFVFFKQMLEEKLSLNCHYVIPIFYGRRALIKIIRNFTYKQTSLFTLQSKYFTPHWKLWL